MFMCMCMCMCMFVTVGLSEAPQTAPPAAEPELYYILPYL